MSATCRQPGCHIEMLPDSRTCEFAAYASEPVGLREAGWPSTPGEVRFGTHGLPSMLHFAPGRWLVPDPGCDTITLLQAAVIAGVGTCMEVQGKWRAMILSGQGMVRVLSSTVDIVAILTGRDCAAVTLFDCPAVVVRTGAQYRVWVASSYAEDFAGTISRLSQAA